MISGKLVDDIPKEKLRELEELIQENGGTLGPGCCQFNAPSPLGGGATTLYLLSNVGDRRTCDLLIQGWPHATFVSYVQGQDCPRK